MVYTTPIALLLLGLSFQPPSVTASSVASYLNPGFQFNYNKPNQVLTIPITSQCERLHLSWSRTANNTGPPPVAPYFLQVYSSNSQTLFKVDAGFGPTFDWDMPFPPNSLYQICIFDIFGTSGGCQEIYSVIPNTTATTGPACQNVTATPALAVSGTVPLGLLSTNSYIDQCTILAVTPQAGKPPFTLTIAPDNHPPFNITSHSMEDIKWKVSLPIGFRFFMSLSSADGLMWANGPLRVGDLGPTDCLAPGSLDKNSSVRIIVGSSMGSAIFGVLVGIAGYYFFSRAQLLRRPPSRAFRGYSDESSRPLKSVSHAPSTIGASSIARSQFSSVPSTPMTSSIPMTTTPSSRLRDLPAVYDIYEVESEPPTPPPPSRPLRPLRHRSVEPYAAPSPPPTSPPPPTPRLSQARPLPTPSESSHTSLAPSQYPPDIKRRIPTTTSVFSRDDTASLASSSSYANNRASVISRAPTYVPNPARTGVYVIDENETPDLPPEYGRHIEDSTYTPSVVSSNRL